MKNQKKNETKQDAQFEQTIKTLLNTPPQPKKQAEKKKKKDDK